MRKIIVFFISSVLVLNSFTTTALATTIENKLKIHEMSNCFNLYENDFFGYVDCLNDQVLDSNKFAKSSTKIKRDIKSLLSIANILSENIEDEFLTEEKVSVIWKDILNTKYRKKIKDKELKKILEGSKCKDKNNYNIFIKCFSNEFRSFEIYKSSNLLNKRRIETIMINALYLTQEDSRVYATTKNSLLGGKNYESADGFDFFFTYINGLGTDFFIKEKKDDSWKKVIKFIVIAVIVAILAKGLLKTFSKGSYSSPSGASASSSGGLTSQQAASSAGVKFQSMGMKNMFRYAPSNSVAHTKWFKYGFVKGFW